ncbi:hypothetical protein E7T06_19060 [Deinococcus sp. Arct2-2]|uniref:hypothetical protein n=1 Tax=Deinococcus sp. Arct2-2 TaxID=2568653 RepID=UPI0010A416EF|nr:hypothetical protein [Deinococcus sp. Arct2-2]THF67892.1 hypothetical protein E7T06_19060 [Deinococcus sp. Arct2-2]
MNPSESDERRWYTDLLRNVVGPMALTMQATMRQGISTHLTPPTKKQLVASFELYVNPESHTSANYLVQRDALGWAVERLMYTNGPDGLQRCPVPRMTFELLPDEAFFLDQLRDFVEHELTQGILRPDSV